MTAKLKKYHLFSCIGIIVASCYPLYMGVKVIYHMVTNGTVLKDNYPKYIIPYTPISVALFTGILLMPLMIKLKRPLALLTGSFISFGIFFALELFLEKNVVVTDVNSIASLEDWQMYMCAFQPAEYRTLTAIEVLTGKYNPAFKLHFYLISSVLIISLLNSFYGFGHIVQSGNKKPVKALVLQSASSVIFLGLCILACFTSFWRDGSIKVSPLSACLMALFFIFFGITFGIFTGSIFVGKSPWLSVIIPSVTASVTTILMYIGEIILLNGKVFRLGDGFLFDSLPVVVLSVADILIIIASAIATALLLRFANSKSEYLSIK